VSENCTIPHLSPLPGGEETDFISLLKPSTSGRGLGEGEYNEFSDTFSSITTISLFHFNTHPNKEIV
jgi:hypothetical protein